MRVYYLERALTDEELEFVSGEFQEQIEQIHLPYLFPIPDPARGYADRPMVDDKLMVKHLRAAGIERDRGTQVAVVTPHEMHWHIALFEAIKKETDFYPYIIQIADQREAINIPGAIRISNGQMMMRGMRLKK